MLQEFLMKKNRNKRISFCKQNINFLKYISSLSIKKRGKIISRVADENEINSLIEIFKNFLYENISCSKSYLKSVQKYSPFFLQIIKKGKSLQSKKKILTSKKGGFILNSLLALTIPILKKIFQ